jgi:predicted nucleic acid-binding protein
MIVLDTNVVSEMMRPRPDLAVRNWLDEQEAETLCLTSTSLSELLAGIEVMPNGRRKQGLAEVLWGFRERFLGNRVLTFDEAAANAYATLVGRARLKGYAVSIADGQIGAIATVRGFTVATRDTSPFEAAGVLFINPWSHERTPRS